MGNRVAAVLACFGLLWLFHLERSFIAGLPAREHAEMRAHLARPQGWAAAANGLLAWADSRDQVNAAGGLGQPAGGGAQRDRAGQVRAGAHPAAG